MAIGLVGHRFARFPPTERHDDDDTTITTGLFLLVSRCDLINRVIGGRLVPTPTCSCFTSEPRPFLGRYETSKHGAAAKSARQRGNVITARTSRRVLFLPACFVRFYFECNNTWWIIKIGSITVECFRVKEENEKFFKKV